MNIKVIDNFLDQKDFDEILSINLDRIRNDKLKV